MRRIMAGCLGLSLTWWGASVPGGEFAASRAPTAGPAATLGRPAASLGRPVAAPQTEAATPAPGVTDRHVTPVGLSLFGRPRPVLAAEPTLPPPTPVGAPGDVWGAGTNRPLGQPVMVGQPAPVGQPAEAGVPAPGLVPGGDACAAPDCCEPCWPFACVEPGPSHCWFSGEYLLWWMRDSQLPPLVTTSPFGTPREQAGVLGAPGTGVLFGDGNVKHDERSGGRFSFGFWFDECHDIGMDVNFFFLGQRTVPFLASSTGTPILARPFFNPVTDVESAELVAFPNVVSGTVKMDLASRLWGIDANLRKNICRGPCWSLDKIIGFRYLDLHESLNMVEFLSVPGLPGQSPSTIVVNDRFTARNHFYGGQVGLQWECRKGRWYLDVLGKVALGGTHQVVNIDGTTAFLPAGGTPVTQPGGLLAQRTNSGHFSRNEFSVVPEIGVKLGYQITPHLRGFIGYNFLYWTSVARPAEQIDRAVNTSQLPSIFGPGQLAGTPRPTFVFRDTDFWVQGISFGLELRY